MPPEEDARPEVAQSSGEGWPEAVEMVAARVGSGGGVSVVKGENGSVAGLAHAVAKLAMLAVRCSDGYGGGGARLELATVEKRDGECGGGISVMDWGRGAVDGVRWGVAALWVAVAWPGKATLAGGRWLEAAFARVGRGSGDTARLWGGRMDAGVQRGVTKLVVASARCGDGCGGGKRRPECAG
jgi:hypothetical protein|uniref:DUF834 domain-containing protein n=2 Tax=Oryza sativa subsp. japonica TaxID=39947 RepID=Q2R668_ORYSJ|nr:hypothetical protein [Oryza sativa Japonica Group]ABA93053.1 hypothetical protein LOC_Os11g22090 [Oryza sativa Japonica Group]